MAKEITYSESKELRLVAEKLKSRYPDLIGYVDLDKIFFAFKGGDVNEFFCYETQGMKSEWIRYSMGNLTDPKIYCVCMTFDYYQKILGSQLEWVILESLYACHPNLDGKLRRKDIHEFSRILKTLEDLGMPLEWRDHGHLPSLLSEETIIFALEQEELF
jgi:hypothetical protein